MKFTYIQKFFGTISDDPFNPPIEDTLVFSGFISDDNQQPKVTNPNIITRNKDWTYANNDYLAGFFGNSASSNSGYVGKWSEDINDNAEIYYIIDEGVIREFIISKYEEIGLTNDLDGFDYFVNIDGNIMKALLEPGDIIYDNYEEAKDQINN